MSNTHLDRAKILTEALPYIQRYNGKIVVVNCGGVAMDAELRDAVATDITMLRLVGIKVVLVHGIGPEVKQALAQSGRELVQKEGVYQIGLEAMEILQEVLCGKVNKDLVALINRRGGRAVGLCGMDGGLFQAAQLDPKYGLVGEILKVDPQMVVDSLRGGYIPVVSTVAQGVDGPAAYNINADTAAAKLAVALGAEKLMLLTDVRGLLRDPADEDTLIHQVRVSEIPGLIKDGVIQGGMIPKIDCAVEAVRSGVHSTVILDGRIAHSILIELLSDAGVGTMLVQ